MNTELDIYFLPKLASVKVIKKFIDTWACGMEGPSEYCIHLEDESELYCDDFDDFLDYITSHEKVSSSLYWVRKYTARQEADVYIRTSVNAVFVFFNQDDSVVLGVGAVCIEDHETVAILNDINDSFDIAAGFVTLGPPPDSRGSFVAMAVESRPPKILRGFLVNT